MSVWTMIFLIVIVAVIYHAWVRNSDMKAGITRDDKGRIHRLSVPERTELEAEVQELRERVKVLERIATDPSRRTADEIEKLRDS
jgi:type VI protein secretion system component VasK